MSRNHLRQFFFVLAVAPHVLWAITLEAGGVAPVALCALAAALTVWRLHRCLPDRPRPRWVTRLVDEPVFAHWAAGALGLLLLPLTVVLALATDLRTAGEPVGAMFVRAWQAAYALGLAAAIWGTWVERRWVRVRRVTLHDPRISPGLDGLSIAHLSDLHLGSFDREDAGAAWVARVNQLRPDIVAITGDLVTHGPWFYNDAINVLGKLQARLGAFAVLGNHDRWDRVRLIRGLQSRGIKVLDDEAIHAAVPDGNLIIAGVDEGSPRDAKVFSAWPSNANDRFGLLLAHYPAYLKAAATRDIGLVLSGHTHGGQIGFPGFGRQLNIARLTGQVSAGSYFSGRSTLVVSAGLGCTGIPLRLGIRPEIILIVLRSAHRERDVLPSE